MSSFVSVGTSRSVYLFDIRIDSHVVLKSSVEFLDAIVGLVVYRDVIHEFELGLVNNLSRGDSSDKSSSKFVHFKILIIVLRF